MIEVEACGATTVIRGSVYAKVCTEPQGHYELLGTPHRDKWDGLVWEE